MCTVDLSVADHDIGIEASADLSTADLSTADLFVMAVTRYWKSLAMSRLPLLYRFKYVSCLPPTFLQPTYHNIGIKVIAELGTVFLQLLEANSLPT